MQVTVTDNGQLRQLVQDLGKAAAGIEQRVDKVVEGSTRNVRENLQAQADGSESLGAIGGTITYESAWKVGMVRYELGPDRSVGGGASLLGFFFGWPNGGGGKGDLDGPLRAEAPRMAKAMGDLLGDVL